MTTTFTGS